MLPLSLLLGFGTGLGTHDRDTRRGALWVGLAASVLMGGVLAFGSDVNWAVGLVVGFLLAFANHLAGWCLGSGVRGGAEWIARGLRSLTA